MNLKRPPISLDRSNYRIIMLIDSLESGGAQRQFCLLANGLHDRGFCVEVITYFPNDFYRGLLRPDIEWECIDWKNYRDRTLRIARLLRQRRPRAVIAFLETPAWHAEVARLMGARFHLIVSERNFDLMKSRGFILKKGLFHALAHSVVCNTRSQADLLRRMCPWISSKVMAVRNSLDLDTFRPSERKPNGEQQPPRGLVLARYAEQKNGGALLEAVAKLRDTEELTVCIDWYGNRFYENGVPTALSTEYQVLREQAKRLGITDYVKLNDKHPKPEELFRQYDFLVLPSLYEGCPNVVAEAMACGLPVLGSNIGDIPDYVIPGRNGWLFDPNNSSSIADALTSMLSATPEQRAAMGDEGARMAADMFSIDTMINAYVRQLPDSGMV